MSGPKLRPSVLAAREVLAEGREKLRMQHQAGSPGIQVCARLTDLIDTVVLNLYHSALVDLGDSDPKGMQSQIALVPHGGYGRRDIAPYSDVDLMLLYNPQAERIVQPLAKQLSQDIVDVGLELGFSSRTPAIAVSKAMQDPKIFTALAESRYLGGSVSLFTRFMSRFRRTSNRRSKTVVGMIKQARKSERAQFGETVYLLKPNVKKSRGCLRDIHFLRWVGFARYGECEPRNLFRQGVLSGDDRVKLREAREFLLRLRNELHFHAGKSQDVLDRSEQMRIAELHGYKEVDGMVPPEQFMREFFEHTSEVRYIVSHFGKGARVTSAFSRIFDGLMSHQMEGDYWVGSTHISTTSRGHQKIQGDLEQILRLMDMANANNKRIAHETWRAIRSSMMELDRVELSPEVVRRFLQLLSNSPQLGEMLRKLHQLGVLEKIIPPMKHARSLMQFNDYHKYTVDEHSIRTVERATDFVDDEGPLGEAYRGMRNKSILHLALLLHDLGKGFPEDHSIVGERLADETGVHLGLGQDDRETLMWLVRNHLNMNHTAQRRNIDDPDVVLQFAVEVGSPDRLQMLFILSCADLAAVGPGVLNPWKQNLLTELYRRTRRHLAWEDSSAGYQSWVTRRRAEIRALIKDDDEEMVNWIKQLDNLPVSYVVNNPPERVVEELSLLERLPSNDALAWGRFCETQNAVEYTVAAHDSIVPGIFYRLTGTLSSKGHEILSAEINTLPGNYVLDRFYVNDLDSSGPPQQSRIDEICDALASSLKNPSNEPPTFRRVWNSEEKTGEVIQAPTKVRVDNTTSDRHTIIDVFAHDRIGLLYTITRTLFDLGLTIAVAKIGTYIDQVVDVFYVTDEHGNKVEFDDRIQAIRDKLLAAIQEPEVSEV